ncbi:hypothetical protein N7466_008111 [Penicillium verhagenii]|uniref:uncharacterized protein n=1 Tax=Penicillium verhagenii TaxID=1562060 RepID=UPI0025458790|nr:uncharacterized protein N7466_008111 [Penicillium verhagenii]KAJ5923924.1 hypothetical protein N7466_008111 [Penicillium verhagenii]
MSSPSNNSCENPYPSLLAALPNGYAIRRFTGFRQLYLDASNVRKLLEESSETDGNQFLVLLGLSERTIDKIANNGLTGINYRFAWEGSVGLIKVVPGSGHEQVTGWYGLNWEQWEEVIISTNWLRVAQQPIVQLATKAKKHMNVSFPSAAEVYMENPLVGQHWL